MRHKIETRTRIAGILIALGLIVQMMTLIRLHALSFVVFLGVGGPLLGIGIALFLWSVIDTLRMGGGAGAPS